ncbi:SGNH/GDSL hydrolase family protein [uncultured Pseudodesulfovibrio sp.]|uniref:SGNH/GDSL hydrolase family protein n=1 Tax=uncultured Pseudodesulfovibrio sp. TaxID=2035858 RepID=UPI0029C95417|nr:SGNH/GDSL hydrolase family protein [uncultured Pseudodesulfovibrio sp.]
MLKRFFITFGLVALLYGGFAAFNFSLVYLAGETRPYTEIARAQQTNPDTLYGPLFNNDHEAYKYALMEERPHEVVVAGSSRALQFRQPFFSKPMVNCGRIMSSVQTALDFFEYMEKEPPRTILVTFDFWWFRDPLNKRTGGHKSSLSTGTERSLDMFFLPSLYVAEGKISIGRVLQGSPLLNGQSRRIGLRSVNEDAGFEADGSHHEPQGSQRTHADMVANVKTRIGRTEFRYNDRLQTAAVDALFAEVAKLESLGHKVIVLFPPLSPAFEEELENNPGYAYVAKTLQYAERYGAVDMQDPARLGLTTDYFMDSLHPSPRGDAKVLLELVRLHPELGSVLDLDAIKRFLASGRERPE